MQLCRKDNKLYRNNVEGGGLAGQLLELLVLHDLGGRASHEEDVRGVHDGSPAEPGSGPSGCDLSLVGVVVENGAELLHVHLAQCPGHRLGESVCDGIGVSDTFPLDELDLSAGEKVVQKVVQIY